MIVEWNGMGWNERDPASYYRQNIPASRYRRYSGAKYCIQKENVKYFKCFVFIFSILNLGCFKGSFMALNTHKK